jgi:hypothetical protein
MEDLRRIRFIWHTRTNDYSQLKFLEGHDLGVASSVFEIDGSLFNLDVAVVKLAVFPWEVVSFEFETHAYSWIDGYGIGPRFIAHVTAGGDTVIGFVMEK